MLRLEWASLTSFIAASAIWAAPQAPETPLAVPPPVAESPIDHSSLPDTIDLRDYVVLPAVGHYGRLAVQQDAVEAEQISGHWKSPIDGETIVTSDGGTKTWRGAAAKDDALETRGVRGGYAFTKFDSPDERVMLLEAAGDAAVYVNGELHTGDPYNLGWLRLPVLVRKGENTLLFHLADDQLSARLTKPPGDAFFMNDDRTLPTLVRGETQNVLGAVPVVNATREWLKGLQLQCTGGGGEPLTTPVAPIPPLSVRKLAFQIPAGHDDGGDKAQHTIRLLRTDADKPQLAKAEIELKRVGPSDIQVRTFRSRIDGSVQPYAARPALQRDGPVADRLPSVGDETSKAAGVAALPGMIVTLHDAAVSCDDQVALYTPKTWAHIIAPTGRRPYGFDWEDWGRIDVLEALEDAEKHYRGDPSRTYLTGHSMGGHGTWHLGVTYPDLFAAIGPSGGWASFWSYGGGMPTIQNPSRIEELELRSYLPSDTVQLLGNLLETGIYVLHGAEDETVPVAQARFMRSRLAAFHGNFAYYEKPGAEHAWGGDSCDWPPMMEFFQRLSRPMPEARQSVDFATADPGVSSRCDWLTIEAQQEPLKLSHAVIRQDVDTRTFVGQTTNVARLAIDVSHLTAGQTIDVTLDGQQMQWIAWPEETQRLWFEHQDKQWRNSSAPSSKVKGPDRSGTFKSAFDHGVLLVYGTGGTAEENRWAEAKARYDAETFWYRGGGSLEVLRDADFDPVREPGRNVILYGNADTNSSWKQLLADCPVQVDRGQVRVGDRTESGNDLGVLMVYPRTGSDVNTVGVVSGTGPVGMRLTSRLRYFVSGIAYPDLMVLGAANSKAPKPSVRGWGYFGPAWTVESGDLAWRASTP
ncbi:MAG TPA: prolyl oligopeptidase family serine peptidase [Lacipirellulaceae bacterium]